MKNLKEVGAVSFFDMSVSVSFSRSWAGEAQGGGRFFHTGAAGRLASADAGEMGFSGLCADKVCSGGSWVYFALDFPSGISIFRLP